MILESLEQLKELPETREHELICGCSDTKSCAEHPASSVDHREHKISALASTIDVQQQFRIERRGEGTEYWIAYGYGEGRWIEIAEEATIYNEVERMADLNGPNYSKLPRGGCWVILDPKAYVECHECGAEQSGATARELAEKVYGLGWLVVDRRVLCGTCQGVNDE